MSWIAAMNALDGRLKLLPTLGDTQIEWANTTLDKQSTLYLAAHFMPSTVQPELQGADHETGIYQVSVFIPLNQGTGAALTLAQAIADWFKRQVINGVSCGIPVLARPLQDAAWWHVPVSIPFVVL